MNLDEIEDTYKNEVEEAEKEFLKGIENKENINELEKSYKQKTKISREKYYNAISKYLLEQKSQIGKSKEPLKEREKIKPLKIEPGNFDLSIFQKLKFKLSLWWFKISFRIKNTINKKTPSIVSYNYIKLKIKIKRFSSKAEAFFERLNEKLRNIIQKIFDILKNFLRKFIQKLKNIFEIILSKFQKKNESSNTSEKSDENYKNKDNGGDEPENNSSLNQNK